MTSVLSNIANETIRSDEFSFCQLISCSDSSELEDWDISAATNRRTVHDRWKTTTEHDRRNVTHIVECILYSGVCWNTRRTKLVRQIGRQAKNGECGSVLMKTALVLVSVAYVIVVR